jgi:homoserine O-acetyltransferase/O-succinyltransferase
MKPKALVLLSALLVGGTPAAAATYPAPVEADHVIRNFRFATGEVLPELRLHYRTIGTPHRDGSGVVRNAVLILHGTSGTGAGFLAQAFAGQLFEAGQLLDGNTHFIILPDAIGSGQSSKPSDGLRARFPRYTYQDMIVAQHKLLTEKLEVNHLRLLLGTSMGAMHTWMWGELYPDFMDALMPLASNPVAIAGRNRVYRKMIIDLIRNDPKWQNGEYETQPRSLVAALYVSILAGSSPLEWQTRYPTRAAADKFLDDQLQSALGSADANDTLYRYESSRDYDPSSRLESIKAPLLAVNTADDFVNPPELRIMERAITRVKRGRFVLIPIGDQTRGHGTHSIPLVWQRYLAELLTESRK